MGDVIFVAITAAFFGLCILLVRGCEHIIGPDPDDGGTTLVERGMDQPVMDRPAEVTP